MKTLRVSEIFYSLQGEGARVGQPSMFIRLSGCDLACGFCDTEFESGKEYTLPELNSKIAELLGYTTHPFAGSKNHWIVWTGGEPCLQLDAEVIQFFKDHWWQQAIETNGNHPVPPGIDWICCSPKVAEHVLAKNFPDGVDELRYVRHSGQPGVPQPKITAKRYFLSPMFRGNQPDPENLKHCIQICLENPQWNLSVQTHKLTKIL